MNIFRGKTTLAKVNLSDFWLSIIVGVLSGLLGYIQFKLPGIEGGGSDFRELPLLISILHTSNPLYFAISSAITMFSTPADGSYLATFVMHFVGLVAAWYLYQKTKQWKLNSLGMVALWIGITLIYYLLFLLPIMLIIYYLEGLVNYTSYWQGYVSTVEMVAFEMITSALVTSTYVIQYEMRLQLKKQNMMLEQIVSERTAELGRLNAELAEKNNVLTATNKEIFSINKNLDGIVQERSAKIEAQFEQLLKYSHMNSHEVRAPLARIIGLINIFEMDSDQDNREILLKKIQTAAFELDVVIRKMNRILESEVER